jgi:glucose-1-phosphate thymidylyltransferase
MGTSVEELIGLVPAAGKGLRLGLPYPKELYPVIRDNRYTPIAQFVVDNLVVAGLRHIVFVINETKHQLMGYFGSGQRFGCRVSYVVQELIDATSPSTSPGLAHALDSAYHLLRGKTVFFGMADSLMTPADIFKRVYEAARPDDEALCGTFTTDHPEKFGMVRTDADQQILEIVDKPARTELTQMWGCMVWRPRFTEHLHRCVAELGVADFAKILNAAIAEGMPFKAVPMPGGTYFDLGTYEEIARLDQESRGRA